MNELATIRRAYRYVVAYERRVLDAIASIDETVRGAGLERNTPYRWEPLYNHFPSRDWAPDHWAWDHVPIFACRYRWNGGPPNAAGYRSVLVDHIADTAFEERCLANGKTEPEPLDELAPVDGSKSILRFLSIELSGAIPESIWKLSWPSLLSKQLDLPNAELLSTKNGPAPVRRTAGPLSVTSGWVDLATVDDPLALDAGFIAPLRAALAR